MKRLLLRRSMVARDLPREWLEDREMALDTPVMVTVEEDASRPPRRLVDFIGVGAGLFGSAEEVDSFIRTERDAWER